MTKTLGIDLSLTSPAICCHEGDEVNLNSCKFYYLTKVKKLIGNFNPLFGDELKEYSNDMERYHFISSWIIHKIFDFEPNHIFLEDYSYSSTGRVFNIAENCGILKYHLWNSGITYTTIPPTVVKKQATGKGNSNKDAMEEAFIKETGFNVRSRLSLSKSAGNPVSDIIDSYYVNKAGLFYNRK